MSFKIESILSSVKSSLPSYSVGLPEILPKLYSKLINKLGSNNNVSLISTLTLIGLLSWHIYWNSIRVPPYLRGLPRVSVWQTIRSAINNDGILELLVKQSASLRKDAYNRGIIKSIDQIPPMWITWFFGKWVVNVSNPVDLKDILTHHEQIDKLSLESMLPLGFKLMGNNIVAVQTNEWKRHRKIVNPAFRRGWAISLFANPTCDLIRHFDELAASKSVVNVSNWMQRITLDALSTAAFGMNFDALNNPDSPILITYKRCTKAQNDPLCILLGRFAGILPRYRQYVKDIDKFNQLVFQLIDKKTKMLRDKGNQFVPDCNQDDKRDLLELMIMAQMQNNESFTREELRSNCVIFILAGHDTTANALTFALYVMGLNPHVQEKARKEVIEILGDVEKGTSAYNFPFPTHEQLNQLRYVTCVIKETMRLFPSVMVLPIRVAMTDHTFESTGIRVPKGTIVRGNIWNVHRSKEYWGEDADQFRPERWESLDLESEGGIPLNPTAHNYRWVPFGGGQRICLGQQFSILEQRVILSSLLLRYRWKVTGDDHALTGFPRSDPGILLNPLGISLELTRRN